MRATKEITDVIATRELVFVGDDGNKEDVLIRIGTPYEESEESWCCPYELVSQSHRKLFGMIGIDSFHALEMTMGTIKAELGYWERHRNGRFHFLGEEGSGIRE